MEEKKASKKPDAKLWVMAVALGLLVIVSGIQAVELVDLKDTVDTELTDLTTASPSNEGSATTTDLQSSIQNLPSMVGGC